MRKIALSVSPEQLGLEPQKEQNRLYGIVIEYNVAGLIQVLYASYADGEAVDMVQNGHYIVSTGDDDIDSGIAKLLYDNAAVYLDFYKDDVKKYLKDASPREAAEIMLSTSFIKGKDNPETLGVIKKYVSAVSDGYAPEGLERDNAAHTPAANKIKISFLTYGGRFSVEGESSKVTSSKYAPLLPERGKIADKIAGNVNKEQQKPAEPAPSAGK